MYSPSTLSGLRIKSKFPAISDDNSQIPALTGSLPIFWPQFYCALTCRLYFCNHIAERALGFQSLPQIKVTFLKNLADHSIKKGHSPSKSLSITLLCFLHGIYYHLKLSDYWLLVFPLHWNIKLLKTPALSYSQTQVSRIVVGIL